MANQPLFASARGIPLPPLGAAHWVGEIEAIGL